jgi:hypothetical protein
LEVAEVIWSGADEPVKNYDLRKIMRLAGDK